MMIRRNNSEESDETLREAFNIFDHDNNNFITCADLRYVIKSLGLDISDETIDEMVREADEDGNGKVGVEEVFKTSFKCMTSDTYYDSIPVQYIR
ncbi:mitochondrial 4mtd3cpv calcium sensor cameleon, partial [Mytilus galloprovincialis]